MESSAALRPFSASCAASHDCFAAVASSSDSYSTVMLPIFAPVPFVPPFSSMAILMPFTTVKVCARDGPVSGRLE